jgi:cytochrome oxidase assembly protein ShyY1
MTGAAVQAPIRPPTYLRTATSGRMLLLLLAMLAAAAVCARLGIWQLDRAQDRRAAAEEPVEQSQPVELDDVLAPQSPMPGALAGRLVTVEGTFGADEVLVAGRTLDGVEGYLVLTPLLVPAGSGDGAPAVLPVVRGWVSDPSAAAGLAPAPVGTVRLTGFVRPPEAPHSADLPDGQVSAVSPAELVNRWGGPIYSAYVALSSVDPPQDQGLRVLPPPAPAPGGLNLQNLAYALQWWIFGGLALAIWGRIVRDDTRAAREELVPSEGLTAARTAQGADAAP